MSRNGPPRIVVTGGSGTIGSELLRLLSARGVAVRGLSRRPSSGAALPGVEWVAGDLADRDALPGLFAGAERLFLLAGNVADAVRLQKNAIAAAKKAGVLHVVKLSALGASDHSQSVIGLWHWIVERELAASGMAWTFLRPHHFMQNLLDQRRAVAAEGVVRSAAGDGRIPFIDTRDVAAVAAEVLTGAGHGGKIYALTGPEAFSYRDATALLAEAIGRPLVYVAETPDEHRVRRRAAGDPEWSIAAQLAIAAYQRAGGPTEATTATVEEVTGRPPRSFRVFARDHAESFAQPSSTPPSVIA